MTTHKLLTRDQFREQTFARDKHKCVFCGKPAQDAHHILDRKLWADGGYYLSNGASVCAEHHMQCETTEISVVDVRKACGIKEPILPPDFEPGEYDKWGNPVLANGQRLKGPMFHEESVQKILGQAILSFTDRVKYPRTPHVPWSPGGTDDDKVLDSVGHFIGKQVVASYKMDGENTTLARDYMHARSVDSKHHLSRDWVKQFWASIRYDIPTGFRICGENMYAKHSIYYEDLPSYFLGFSIWNAENVCLSWKDTKEWFELLGITWVPMFFSGPFDEKLIREWWEADPEESNEGYVIRLAESFHYNDFAKSVAKFVRKDHVQTDDHWSQQTIMPNKLKRS